MLATISAAVAQTTATSPLADPNDFQLDIEAGPVRPGYDRTVVVATGYGQGVVGKLLVHVGDRRVVMLPDGHLKAFDGAEVKFTSKPFVPSTMKEIAEQLTAEQFAGFKWRNTTRYLYVYNTSEPFYLATSRILETMYPGVMAYARNQKINVHEPDVPMVVVMFKTEREFQKYYRMPAGVVAYYNPLSNHVTMYEESLLNVVAPTVAVQQSIATIAHEGAHQILHNIGMQQRLSRWPMWISEGLAEYFAPTYTGTRLRWKGAGKLNEQRLKQLDAYLTLRPSDAKGDLVEHTVAARQLTSTGYATAWALTHFLAQRRWKQFHEFLNELSQYGPLEIEASDRAQHGQRTRNLELFVKHFGNDMDGLEAEVVQHLDKLLKVPSR